jgi:hypothetical protein
MLPDDKLKFVGLPLFVAGLSPPAPIPPLTLFDPQLRVLRLGNGRGKNIKAADVLRLPGYAAKLSVHLPRILAYQFGDAADLEKLQVAQRRRTYRNQVL